MEVPPKYPKLFVYGEHSAYVTHPDRRDYAPKWLFEEVEDVKKFNQTTNKKNQPR